MKILVIVVLVLAIYFLIEYLGFLYTFSNRIHVNMEKMMRNGYAQKLQNWKNRLLSYPMKEITITSEDDLKLYGRYFHREGNQRLLIMCHGWKSEWYIDFSEIALWFYESMGCDLLIIDERAIGKSEGRYITFGVKEKDDIQRWISWTKENQSLPVYLYGTSMGAASVLMASEDQNNTVSGIIADSPFTDAYDELKDFSHRILKLPEHPFMDTLSFFYRLFVKADMKETDVMKILPDTSMPILIFHGTNDFFCNVKMSQKIKMNNYPNVKVVIFDDCNHCCGYVKYKEEYQKEIIETIFHEVKKEIFQN